MMLPLVVAVTAGLLLAACGAGGGERQAAGTATSERVERQATVAEGPQEESDAGPPQPAAAPPARGSEDETAAAQAQGNEDEAATPPARASEDDGDEEVDTLPAEIVGEHKGLRSERNMLGDPEAPVEIRYFGDFT